MHTVGTFRVSSAAYWWSRVGGSFSRLAQYIIGTVSSHLLLPTADELDAEAAGPASGRLWHQSCCWQSL